MKNFDFEKHFFVKNNIDKHYLTIHNSNNIKFYVGVVHNNIEKKNITIQLFYGFLNQISMFNEIIII